MFVLFKNMIKLIRINLSIIHENKDQIYGNQYILIS